LHQALRGALGGTTRSLTPERNGVNALTWITSAQIALALVLLTGAGLLFSTLLHLEAQDFGFGTARIQTFGLSLPNRRYRDLSNAIDFEQKLLEKLRQIPGITSAASGPDPTAGDALAEVFSVSEGGPESTDHPRAVRVTVSSQFFETLRIPLLQGSDFPSRIREDSEPLAIVNEQVAQRYFRGANPIAAHIRFGVPSDPNTARAPWYRIVGVVGGTRSIAYNADAWKSDPQVYLDFRQERKSPIGATNWGRRKCDFLVATDARDGLASSELQRAVWKLDPELPVGRPEALTKKVMARLTQPKMRAQVLIGFAGISLLLAALYAGAAGVLLAVAILAALLPARRAAATDPMTSLRAD